jgi:hypothetical protein
VAHFFSGLLVAGKKKGSRVAPFPTSRLELAPYALACIADSILWARSPRW